MAIEAVWRGALACALVGGCSDDDDALSNPRNVALVDAGRAQGNQLASQFEMTTSGQSATRVDSVIAGIVQEIDNGAIAEAQQVLPLATSQDVISFASLVVASSAQNNQQLLAVMADTHLAAAASPVTTSLMAMVVTQTDMIEQQAVPAMPDVDLTYMEGQVMMNEAWYVLVQGMRLSVTSTELAGVLGATLNMIGDHLDSAQRIVADDFGPATAGG